MEVGDYVRTKEGIIARLINIDDEDFDFDTGIIWSFEYYKDFADKEELEKVIYKYSSNIIDLIEVGDYVNGKQITRIVPPDICGDEELSDKEVYIDDFKVYKEWIKSILTKEQFESMEYKVGGK